MSPFEKGEPHVTWANTHLPFPERLEQLTATKPWQLNLAKGEEVLDMTVPHGVAIRDKPARSTRAVANTESDAATNEEGGKSALAEAVLAAEHPGDKAGKVPTAMDDVQTREVGTHADVPTPMDDDVSTNPESKSPSGTGDVAAPEEDNVDPIAELAAAGLMAVAAGAEVPKKQKRGRGRPRRIMTQEESDAARIRFAASENGFDQLGYGETLARGGLAGTLFPPIQAPSINPVLLAAYEAGRADATATSAMHAGVARSVSPPGRVPVPGPSQMSIADIVGKFYNYKPSIEGPDAFPLTSFGNLGTATPEYLGAQVPGVVRPPYEPGPSVPLGVPLGAGPQEFAGGSHANNESLRQWQKTLAALSGRAGHPTSGVFAVDPIFSSLFAPHVTADQMMEVRLANERAFAELAREVDACASIARLNRDEERPRAALCVRVENALRRVTEKRQVLGAGDKTKIAAGVLELQTWVKAQLQLRIEELIARAWEKESDAGRDKGKAPVDTGAFAALATVAAASQLPPRNFERQASESDVKKE